MKILVVDDEKSIVNLIRMNLELEGYKVVISMTGIDAVDKFKMEKPELVILDIMLPDISGHEVIQKFQKIDNEIPVIMLTANSQMNDKLLGLQLGADDYITKPFNSAELILRIKAITKRSKKKDNKARENNNEINIKGIRILKDERKILIDGQEVATTYKEFDTLLLMMENCNKVFTREKLLERVWGYEYEGNTRAVDILIQRLRRKLGIYSESLKTIYGVGYKLEL
ncbi:response regulator transcription factor [Clostridium saccharobutylicum]|uniref:Stage 0 sporulation protein A homolog n=1 Tax=Clostridium saccharobutylicum DSM 13864 TaxID=1345695 RepID=U5MLP7_CLOSA|nr:response regulator transcription factor [Clostridium saccharobutylicum]AGX41423.1 transcriptional regulatory protein WalR [Clostridium saccharobutylicum DSM 13864]AQR88703.1 transcriptional regulatory protein WalR [Clostridium saccharobutylicum]AQR98601.1 transcriptional regulatory protein WalR [Clostridium saccharobutylicum]AQS08322.1 transcriptional regulatory protein WalR [Clostridium saccharobutylicum]AQS12591.1 transcriptional regulatory protein WalR [Clostridium saccharobutylicum]